MNNESQLTVINPGEQARMASDVAGVCKEIVTKSAITIQGKKYVPATAWEAIATAHGCIASSRDVQKIEGGVRAIGELKRMDTGAVVATAEGFVGDDEPKWANGPEYARRGMVQTRAVSRVCKQAFAHIIVMMNAGLETTPLEEVPENGFASDARSVEARQEQREARDRANAAKPMSELRRVMNEPQAAGDWRNAICTYGKKDGPLRGKQLGELTDKNLEFLGSMFLTRDRDAIDAKDLPLYDALAARKSQAAEAAPQVVAVDSNGDPIMDNDEIPF
jgi:hypothetical protein